MCVHLCVWVHGHICSCMWKGGADVGCLGQLCSILFFEAGSLVELGAHQLDGQGCQGSPHSH